MDASKAQIDTEQSMHKPKGVLMYFKVLTIALAAMALITLGFWLSRVVTSASSIQVNLSRPAVIQKIRSLARLETASYTIEKIVDAGTNEPTQIQEMLFGDKLLLIAHGQVIAGFDLSQISEKDIKIDGKMIEVTLPAAQILVATLDNNKTHVYDRDQGILSRANKDLESVARQRAQDSILQAACQGNILEEATRNVKKQLEAFLSGLEFETVSIIVPQSGCI